MRWTPIILDIVLAALLWAAVLTLLRQRRARRLAATWPLAEARSGRLHEVSALAATIGVTWFLAWFITATTGPSWLHLVSVRAAIVFIVVGAVVAGYAGWVGGP